MDFLAKRITVRFTINEYNRIKEYAHKNNRQMSDIFREQVLMLVNTQNNITEAKNTKKQRINNVVS